MKWVDIKKYAWYLVGLVVCWAVVPAFAKLGNLDGIQKTFWINWFAVGTMVILIPIVKKKKGRKVYGMMSSSDLLKIASLGLIFPLGYSICYFQSIFIGSPALTTIIGRSSLFIYAFLMVYVLKRQASLTNKDKVLLVITVLSVTIAVANKINWTESLVPAILLAIGAAVLNGVYSAISELWKNKEFDPLLLIFIVEVVTAVLVTPLAIIDGISFPDKVTLFYLFVIGAFANGVAFWLQLEGFQIAARLEDTAHKVIFLVFQAGVVTFVQIAVLVIMKAEKLNMGIWVAVLLLVAGLIWHRLPEKKKI